MRRLALVAAAMAAMGLVGISDSVIAADLRVKAPPKAAVQQVDSWYIWVDGSYQSIGLPTYDVGLRQSSTFAATDDLGPVHSFKPRAEGYGFAGAIGYKLPGGTLPFAHGANARVEVGFSYAKADVTQSTAGAVFNGPGVVQLNGNPAGTFNCVNFACSLASTLATDYAAWQVFGKVASDYRMGTATITPSVTVFGGHARNDQVLAQTLTQNGNVNDTYFVNSALDWNDWGAKLGLDAKLDVAPGLVLGLGGKLGLAGRHVSLTATDSFANGLDTPTAIAASASTASFLADAEASLTYSLTQSVALRAFGGARYDSRVPGIAAATGVSAFVNGVAVTTPAGIKFESTTSWYAGGGATWKFGS